MIPDEPVLVFSRQAMHMKRDSDHDCLTWKVCTTAFEGTPNAVLNVKISDFPAASRLTGRYVSKACLLFAAALTKLNLRFGAGAQTKYHRSAVVVEDRSELSPCCQRDCGDVVPHQLRVHSD